MNVDFELIKSGINNRTYKYIGSGSGRSVFDLGNGYVIKVARNKKGEAQNQAEHQIALNDRSNIVAKIMQISEDYKWLIMEKADRVKSMSKVWEYFNVKNNRELFQIKELRDITSEHDLLQADLYRPTNWGKVGDRFVIIDYGFTRKVRKKYYFPF